MEVAQDLSSSKGRLVMDLDGIWDFAADPQDVGETHGWYAADDLLSVQNGDYPRWTRGKIHVPGIWNAQGYGVETERVRHDFSGKGWYRKTILVPQTWASKRIFLCIGGVNRYAKIWINKSYVGEHIGCVSNFEFDITQFVRLGQPTVLTIQVDSKQRWEVDTLASAADFPDGVFVNWGGIWGHVTVEARADVWLEDIFIKTAISPASCSLSAVMYGEYCDIDLIRVAIFASDTSCMVNQTILPSDAIKDTGQLLLTVNTPNAKLWSTDSPYLYTCRISLLKGDDLVDGKEVRFGIREIKIIGTHFLLNGKKVLLRGCGDDHVYPKNVAMPSDKSIYRDRLKLMKAYGFNYIRVHSTIMPPEYYEACDEIGMLISAEFPIAYDIYYSKAITEASQQTYRNEWVAAIKRYRNHPCVFNWCMGNEFYTNKYFDGIPLRHDFYRLAKDLDPTRPCVDSDGLMTDTGWVDKNHDAKEPKFFVIDPEGLMTESKWIDKRDRDTLDFFPYMFDVLNTPLDAPNKYEFRGTLKPIVSHETGNFVTFPRMDQIENFVHELKPFWLIAAKQKLEKIGLIDEAALWSENSEKLYGLCIKNELEALRKNPHISGYHWWLFQDWFTSSVGLVGIYFRPKSICVNTVLQVNNDIVLLQDGLKLTYWDDEALDLEISVSNFSSSSIDGSTLNWAVEVDGQIIAHQDSHILHIGQGDLKQVTVVKCNFCRMDKPKRVLIKVSMAVDNRMFFNEWTTWVFPRERAKLSCETEMFAEACFLDELKCYNAKVIPSTSKLSTASAVYVARNPSHALINAVEAGSCLILLSPDWILPVAMSRFRPAWWCGDLGGWTFNNYGAGTVVYDNPITREITPDGWCDAGWYNLLEGAKGFLLDGISEKPHVFVRGVEDANICRDKAFLFEVGCGKGTIIASGLNHNRAKGTPENTWLLTKMLEYALTFPKSHVSFPNGYLCDRINKFESPKGPFWRGFKRILNPGEKFIWHSYIENSVLGYCCRQTDVENFVTWETESVPRDACKTAVFVFAGGMGYKDQPDKGGFELRINSKKALDFDLVFEPVTIWTSQDECIKLRYEMLRQLPGDTFGIFYLEIPISMLAFGRPCLLSVKSNGSGSLRWFVLHPYEDIIDKLE